MFSQGQVQSNAHLDVQVFVKLQYQQTFWVYKDDERASSAQLNSIYSIYLALI